MPENTATNRNVNEAKLVSSRLYTEASQKLEEETEKEKKVEDPDVDEAKSAIDAAEITGDQK